MHSNQAMRPGIWMMHAVICVITALAHPALADESNTPPATVSPAGAEEEFDDGLTYDPWERMNRGTYAFNQWFDRWIFKPAAKGYAWVLPDPVQNAVSRAFLNLTGPTVILNDLLQGKWRQSGADSSRFVINTTVGLVGFFDVATKWGFPAHDEDFGQTLGVWGVGPGPYLVLPIIGPRNFRDTGGLGMDIVTDVNTYVKDDALRYGLYTLRLVNQRARLLGATDVLTEATGDDSYVFVRESYTGLRRNLIYDGNPPAPKFFDDEAFDETPAGADPTPAEPHKKP
jgi:phospholipid-binding lipoprotein MlaA